MAATDLERLVVQLSADIKKYESSLNRAQGITNQRARAIENRFARMNRTMAAGFAGLGASAAKAFAVIGGVAGTKNLLDAGTRITNSLKVAGLAGTELERVYEALFQSATKNAAPLETLAALYGKAAQNQKELGVTTDELLGFTDNVALALRVAGTDAQTASGALLQLGQALGSGKVQAEEFNSVLEGAPTIAQAVAAGLKEAGGSVARLKGLVVDGKISSEAFFRAFEAGAPLLEQKVAGATYTLDQRLTNLQTSLIDAAKRFNESTEASKTFGAEIDRTTAFVNSLNFDSLIQQIASVVNALNQGIASAKSFGSSIGEATGLDNIGSWLTGGSAQKSFLGGALTITSTKEISNRINDAFAGEIQKAGELTSEAIKNSVLGGGAATTPKGGRLPSAPTVKPVSINDFAPPPGKTKKGSKRGDDLAREIKQIQERTSVLQSMTAVQAGINPLVDDYGFAIEKARAKQELLNAAQSAGKTVTPELAAQIETLSTAYATATVEAEKLAESQDKIRARAEDMRNFQQDLTRGIVDGFLQGKKAADVFADALSNIGNKLLDLAFDSAFDSKTGFLGNLFSGLFSGGGSKDPWAGLRIPGRATGGPVSAGQPYVVGEKRPELFVPRTSGTIIPRIPEIGAKGGGSGVNVSFAPVYNVQGSGPEIDRLREQMARDRAEFEGRVQKIVSNRPKRGW